MTQNERLLKHLRKRPITTLQAVEKLGILRLSERIRELEAQGWLINHNRVKVKNRHNESCYVVRYSLAIGCERIFQTMGRNIGRRERLCF